MNFREKVYKLTAEIPKGKVATYSIIAQALGDKGKARAVGNALNKNKDLQKVPCYRVVKSNGEIGGYAHGQQKKVEKLKIEGIEIKRRKIVNLDKLLHSY